MLFPLAARLDPYTVSVALAVPPLPDSVALPRVVLPSLKAMVPAGATVPLAALTVAVSAVDPADAMVEGLAATDVVVATAGAVTVTVVEPLELAKFPLAL